MKSAANRYLAGLALLAIFGWATFAIALMRLDPYTSTTLALPFFFGGLFFGLIGTLAVLGFYARLWLRFGEVYTAHIGISLRQSILVATAVSLALVLQILRILTWWDAVLIALAVFLVELYFASRD